MFTMITRFFTPIMFAAIFEDAKSVLQGTAGYVCCQRVLEILAGNRIRFLPEKNTSLYIVFGHPNFARFILTTKKVPTHLSSPPLITSLA